MLTVDCRCNCLRCQAGSQDMYRMVGNCWNCGQNDVLMLFRKGDPSYHDRECPKCGYRSLKAKRLATRDEIPAA